MGGRAPMAYVYKFNVAGQPSHSQLVDETGDSFLYGTAGGFIYNLIKHRPLSLNANGGLKSAFANAPRVGGFCALWYLSIQLPRLALAFLLRGGRTTYPDEVACFAAGAALMWSPRGFRTASRAALLAGGFSAALLLEDIHRTRAQTCPCAACLHHHSHSTS